MRYPPTLTIAPQLSWVYRVGIMVTAIILIAPYAMGMPGSGDFSSKNAVAMALAAGLAACAALGAVISSWRKPAGQLVFSQGVWYWQRGGQDTAGTLCLHFDLQLYLLVRFTPSPPARSIFNTTSPWFHLEARQFNQAAPSTLAPTWPDVRRAVYFSQALSRQVDASEKPAL